MLYEYTGSKLTYIDRYPDTKEERCSTYTPSNFPVVLQKKITLIEHFRKHLLPDFTPKSRGLSDVYIKKWLTTSHAIIFRLSNKLVQVDFQDNTELVLCSETKNVVYYSKSKEIVGYSLSAAMDSGYLELTKRLRYTKEVLTNMLQPNGGTGECRPPLIER